MKDFKAMRDALKAYRDKEKGPTEAARSHSMELVRVLMSGEEAKEVVALDKVFYDSSYLHVFVKFIDGKTYHLQVSAVPSE